LTFLFDLQPDVILPNAGADPSYDQTVATIKKIERDLEVHLREAEAIFKGKVSRCRASNSCPCVSYLARTKY
jgi:hypothetical protein